MENRRSYYRYWAKSPNDRNPSVHLVPYHNLDVAACGKALFQGIPRLRKRLGQLLGLDVDRAEAFVVYLLALHDIGKFADSFQSLQPKLAESLGGPVTGARLVPPYPPYHGPLGALAWREWMFEDIGSAWGLIASALSKRRARASIQPVIDAVMGHHGRPVQASKKECDGLPFFCEEAVADLRAYALDAARLILPDEFNLTWKPDLIERSTRASWLVAGIAVLADWLGSNAAAFPRCDTEMELGVYWKRALAQAEAAVRTSGVLGSPPARGKGVDYLFDFDDPTPLQHYAETVEVAGNPNLFVFEDLTGEGKTEAAIVLAHRLMQFGMADGLYIGLPTMATADQMFERLEKIVERLFERPDAASVVLAHSARDLSGRYQEIVLAGEAAAQYGSTDTDADRPGGAQCAAWIADRKKKALLAGLGIGTIDQALLSILPAGHQSLRLLGLNRNVLLVDEVHAYDRYMLCLLERLLTFHAAQGGSAILLSATLPHATRQTLCDAFRTGLSLEPEAVRRTALDDYPLATHVSPSGLDEKRLARRAEARRTIRVQPFRAEAEVVGALVAAAKAGRCAVWVRNTVDDAIRGLGLVREAIEQEVEKLRVDLLHARYALGDRLEKQGKILSALGPDGDPDDRRGRIVVATQVIEQSLDLDADFLVTDLAPIDLVLQRAGRLRRHVRDADGRRLEGKARRDHRYDGRGEIVLGVLAPPLEAEPSDGWFRRLLPGASFVYPDHGRMWLGLRELEQCCTFTLPDDARALVEAVYRQDSKADIPPGLLHATEQAENEGRRSASTGSFNALDLEEGYGNDGSKWTQDDAQRTRLADPTVTLRLARVDSGEVVPLVPGGGWAHSEVSVNASKFERSVLASDVQAACLRAEDSMPDRGRGVILVPLSENDEAWTGQATDQRGRALRIRYSKDCGLELTPDKS